MQVLLDGKFEKVLQIIIIIVIIIIIIVITIIIIITLFSDIAGHTCPTNRGDKLN